MVQFKPGLLQKSVAAFEGLRMQAHFVTALTGVKSYDLPCCRPLICHVQFVIRIDGLTQDTAPGASMTTPQTIIPSKVLQVPFSSASLALRQSALGNKKPQDMVVRNPAPDASAPMVQTEHRAFSLSY